MNKEIDENLNELFAALSKAKLEWEMTFDNAMELIVLLDEHLCIMRCNRSFAEFVQIPFKKLIGRKITEFLHSGSKDIANNKEASSTEIRTKDDRWINISYCPIKSDEGENLYSILIGTDITMVKKIQKRLEASERELRKKVEELEKF
jgi:PAS domain S-box-containing protein